MTITNRNQRRGSIRAGVCVVLAGALAAIALAAAPSQARGHGPRSGSFGSVLKIVTNMALDLRAGRYTSGVRHPDVETLTVRLSEPYSAVTPLVIVSGINGSRTDHLDLEGGWSVKPFPVVGALAPDSNGQPAYTVRQHGRYLGQWVRTETDPGIAQRYDYAFIQRLCWYFNAQATVEKCMGHMRALVNLSALPGQLKDDVLGYIENILKAAPPQPTNPPQVSVVALAQTAEMMGLDIRAGTYSTPDHSAATRFTIHLSESGSSERPLVTSSNLEAEKPGSDHLDLEGGFRLKYISTLRPGTFGLIGTATKDSSDGEPTYDLTRLNGENLGHWERMRPDPAIAQRYDYEFVKRMCEHFGDQATLDTCTGDVRFLVALTSLSPQLKQGLVRYFEHILNGSTSAPRRGVG